MNVKKKKKNPSGGKDFLTQRTHCEFDKREIGVDSIGRVRDNSCMN